MRLINSRTLALEEFSLIAIPPYAILSHTWGADEVSFQDMALPLPDRAAKKGFLKIQKTCELAVQDGYGYAWVDTCCIDKTSSAELTESINSMFKWYKDAGTCYVFLEDLPTAEEMRGEEIEEEGVKEHDKERERISVALGSCRWFTRGWTLQELLAPGTLRFYDRTYTFRGDKKSLIDPISTTTRVPKKVLWDMHEMENLSVAARMSWAACRQTTRVEDTAYCLLGLFDVNMPLLYGEGIKAFRRLQEEIVRRKNDNTIFAWSPPADQDRGFLGLFAPSPAVFFECSHVVSSVAEYQEFSVTNKGVKICGGSEIRVYPVRTTPDDREVWRYHMPLGYHFPVYHGRGIYLHRITPQLFCRAGSISVGGLQFSKPKKDNFPTDKKSYLTDYYILIDPLTDNDRKMLELTHRLSGIHVPLNGLFRLIDQAPDALWDHSDRVFLHPQPYGDHDFKVYAMQFSWAIDFNSIIFVVLRVEFINSDSFPFDKPCCIIFKKGEYPQYEARLFQHGKYRSEVSVGDLYDGSDIWTRKDYLDIDAQEYRFRVHVFVEDRGHLVTRSLKFNVSEENSTARFI